MAVALGADDRRDARGLALADFDNDGDLDMVINNNPGDLLDDPNHARATLLRNDIGAARNWIAVALQGTQSNRDGAGALVTVETSGRRQTRHALMGTGYASQHTARLYFGLDKAEQVEMLTVQWPSGVEQQFQHVAPRQLVRVIEGQGLELATWPPPKPSLVQLSAK